MTGLLFARHGAKIVAADIASDLVSNITGVNLPVDGALSAGIPATR